MWCAGMRASPLAAHCRVRERVNAGLARARANGVKLGRPTVAPKVEQRVRELRAQGMGLIKIGREVGVGTGTVQRIVGGA